MKMGLLNILSLLYLSLVVAFIFGLNDHDSAKKVIKATLRRWIKILGALIVICIVVQILSHI